MQFWWALGQNLSMKFYHISIKLIASIGASMVWWWTCAILVRNVWKKGCACGSVVKAWREEPVGRGSIPHSTPGGAFQRKMCVKMKRGNTENEKQKQNESQELLQILCLVLRYPDSRIVNRWWSMLPVGFSIGHSNVFWDPNGPSLR